MLWLDPKWPASRDSGRLFGAVWPNGCGSVPAADGWAVVRPGALTAFADRDDGDEDGPGKVRGRATTWELTSTPERPGNVVRN
jgi:hypothetical protein